MSESKLLIQDIQNVFSNMIQPKTKDLISHNCKECESVWHAFANKDWMTLENEVIEQNYDKLPLLSHQAFCYYLPSFLIYSLRNFYPESNVCEFTIYALTPGKIDDEKYIWWKERFKQFSNEQRKIILKFLDLVLENEEFYRYSTIVERGKKRLIEIFN